MKKILVILFIIFGVLLVLSVFKDQMIKSAVSIAGSQITGARIEMKGLSLGILKQNVRISGFKMYNPKGFSNSILIDLPKVNVDYDLASLLKGKLHLRYLEVELQEVNLEKNKDGKLNVDALKVSQSKEAKAPEKTSKREMQIDELVLKIGRVISKDYSAGTPPTIHVHEINLDKKYKNITGAEQLTALILASALQSAGIRGATIYGAAALAGTAILPIGVGAALLGKDFVQEDVNIAMDKLYNVSLDVLKQIGKIKKEDMVNGVINAEVSGAGVTVKLQKVSSRATQITISARKLLLPKQEIAAGVLYQIKEKIR